MTKKKSLSDSEFRERIVVGLAALTASAAVTNTKIDELSTRLNGRIGRLEKTVFGDEELKLVGLAESMRSESREIRSLNRKWAVAIATIVFIAQNAANWSSKKWWGTDQGPAIEAATAVFSATQGATPH